jgi:hypothetical protein
MSANNLAVSTYLMELFVEFFTSSWVVERWNLLSVSLLLRLFLKSFGENMILYYYGSSTLGTRALFLVCGSSPRLNKCSLSSYPLKLNMWSSWVKENGTTQVMHIAKLKDGPKRVKKIFSMILERVFEMV